MKILITGGASGLGAALTKKISEDQNNTVYFTYNSSAEKALVIAKAHKNTSSLKCDFRNEEDIKQLKLQISQIAPDVLINNAYSGNFIKNYFHKTEKAEILDEFRNNVMPAVEITQACIHEMRRKKTGRIITILTSALAGNPPVGASVYTANKAYMQQMVKAWAIENSKFNIISNSVSPSFMETGMHSEMDERLIEQMRESHPLKKFLSPEDVADTVICLLKSSVHLNGTDILINAAQSTR